jgi:hypothetical protein
MNEMKGTKWQQDWVQRMRRLRCNGMAMYSMYYTGKDITFAVTVWFRCTLIDRHRPTPARPILQSGHFVLRDSIADPHPCQKLLLSFSNCRVNGSVSPDVMITRGILISSRPS